MSYQIHYYDQSKSGQLTHGVRHDSDLAGTIGVTGENIKLAGWPTPAMRKGVGGNGDPLAWFVGTDEAGAIVGASSTGVRKAEAR